MSFTERLLLGLETTFIGLVVVFLCLIILIVIIKFLGWMVKNVVLKVTESKQARKKAKEAAKQENKKTTTPVPATKAENIEKLVPKSIELQPRDDAELVAVLTAAVAAMMGTTASKVRIASYKKTKNRSAWANAGRREQIASRF